MIEIENYTKRFFSFVANKEVSLKVGHGVIHGFIGPNGSGKTTTIKTLIGAYTLDEGKMLINGYRPGSREANRLIGYIPERASFPSHLNCIDYLTSMGTLSGIPSRLAKAKAREILTTLAMTDFAKRKPNKFSSGMQKKILLAQALMNDPVLLILDEPSANLDPTARKELQDELLRLRQQGKSILISSHILSELERIVDEVTFLFYGEVLYTGKISEIETQVKGVYVKTSDNALAKQLLEAKDFVVTGDLLTELFVVAETPAKVREINELILSSPTLAIKTFRANDLQSVYDELLAKAIRSHSGHQTLKRKKVNENIYLGEVPR
ncbi:unnamed protein product [Didymodactylos carnosus]|uniref:ABC transporter domain-containing protein n=1 Tax=Didymodactylos carnosus TaxID=1234261 RepID=A0A8S2GCL6_9BILA|nr:unnamed protein product [Didymodactylos carnosus]CAF3491895.1 unnamed protein product [Didymodactylos carnosus]